MAESSTTFDLKRHQAAARRYARRLTADDAAAALLVQDAFRSASITREALAPALAEDQWFLSVLYVECGCASFVDLLDLIEDT